MTRFKPHNYQKKAIAWAMNKPRCGLFLPMGAGKTVTTLTIIQNELLLGEIHKVLIIGPVRVIQSTWPDEIAKWDHTKDMSYSVVAGTPSQRQRALAATADIYLVGKENTAWLIDELGPSWPFDMVVIDELSTFKNPKSQRFRALRKVMPRVDRFIGLTGTPAPKGIPDLWSQIYLMDGGRRLGKTLTAFRRNYLVPGRQNGYIIYDWKPQPDAEERIYRKIGDLCMSLDQSDCAELPPVNYIDYRVKLPEKALDQYHAYKRERILSVKDDTILAANAGVLCGQLTQMTSGEIYTRDDSGNRTGSIKIHAAKMNALDDLIEQANGNPVIVFYYYQHERDRILSHLHKEGLAARELSTAEDIRDWNAGKIDVLLLHPASAGHGLNKIFVEQKPASVEQPHMVADVL